jgi:hypothetical protein
LLHFNDLAWLSESALRDLRQVQDRASRSGALFAEGLALQHILNAAAQVVIETLPRGDRKLERIRATLEGVMAGSSLAAVARSQGKSREYWSRYVWPEVVTLVTHELVQSEKGPGRR